MNAHYVVDVGNSRIKWGRCSLDRVTEIVSLPPDDPAAWQQQLYQWNNSLECGKHFRFAASATADLPSASIKDEGETSPRGAGCNKAEMLSALQSESWFVAGVNPQRRDALIAWLKSCGQNVVLLHSAASLPLRVALERPDAVGIDRLLDAVAANTRRQAGRPAVIVDAGSAVTVDWLDDAGVFRGGAIFPGLRLMSQALNQYTALLPLVSIAAPAPPVPGTSTRTAIEAGVYWSVAGGINTLSARMADGGMAPQIFLTGGDAALLAAGVSGTPIVWPEMTLEGIRLAAQAL